MTAARAPRTAALAAVAGLAILAGCAGPSAPVPSGASSPSPWGGVPVPPITLPAPDAFASEVFDLVNGERRAAGVAELIWSECAAGEAGPRAERTLPAPTLTHEPLAVTCGDFSYLGENLARGPYTPQEMVTAWMNSAGHRQNILDASFVELGIGCAAYDAADPTRTGSTEGKIGGMACSQVFMGNAS